MCLSYPRQQSDERLTIEPQNQVKIGAGLLMKTKEFVLQPVFV
jgi:hypothetical protein